MGTKAEELAKMARGEGCLGKAADDEPIFILRAKDVFAPQTVEYWATTLAQNGPPGAKVKAEDAMEIAATMQAWGALHGTKVPD